MAYISPFRGFLYNRQKVGDLASVVTQPYDIITPEMQEKYYTRSEFNIVRIIKGKDFPNDTPANNKYTRARHYFETWMNEEIFIQDSEPAIYVYAQVYHIKDEQPRSRLGFIALGKLEDYEAGIVFPHEHTHSQPKEDRLQLLRTTRANWGQLFMLYSDPQNVINETIRANVTAEPPVFDFQTEDKIRHRLWRITDRSIIETIKNQMADKSLIIADGHHRYETALRFRDENPGLSSTKYSMMTFINMDDEGLTILPTHRLVRNTRELLWSTFQRKAEEWFYIQEFSGTEPEKFFSSLREQGNGNHVFGLYHRGNKFYSLCLKHPKAIDNFVTENKSEHWKSLDVTIFHYLILVRLLGVDKNLEKFIGYTSDEQEAIRLVNSGEYQWAFFLNPTKIFQIKAVTLAGERMPQKSTYFYPKLLTGLVFHKL